MNYFHWIAGTILALAWVSRIVEAALGMPSVADVSRPEWDRNPVTAAGNPRVSIIVPARNEEESIEQALRTLLALDYDNYEVIAVNDRSTDRTGEIMERVAGNLEPESLPRQNPQPVPPKNGGTRMGHPHYGMSVKFTWTWVWTSSGIWFRRYGLYFHCFTASMAAGANTGCPLTSWTLATLPSLSMITSITTTP